MTPARRVGAIEGLNDEASNPQDPSPAPPRPLEAPLSAQGVQSSAAVTELATEAEAREAVTLVAWMEEAACRGLLGGN